MKDTGILRKIDELGRISIPKALRRTLSLDAGDALQIYVDGDVVLLRKHRPGCALCGGSANLVPTGGKPVCAGCARRVAELVKSGAAH